jgi:hypothetical protein
MSKTQVEDPGDDWGDPVEEERAELFQFVNEGDESIGVLSEIRTFDHPEFGEGHLAEFVDPETGEIFAVILTAGLIRKITGAMLGKLIKVVYTGHENERAPRMKTFNVFVRDSAQKVLRL